VTKGIEQLLGINRLDQQEVDAGLQKSPIGFEKDIPSHADNRQLVIAVIRAMILADTPSRLQTTDTGHGHIHQHHIYGIDGHEREGLFATGGSEDRGAVRFEDLLQTMAQAVVILGQKKVQSR